ncbi:hypothetical protein V6Z05_07640 [Leptospira venezuelensis]|uniref:hypothetical protein n=1 Tax=Leptospira venezuelensis TaxID=1958811 RepID=UPI001F2AEE9B|nr:hypothetical protein [Leptospira venezuelensis]
MKISKSMIVCLFVIFFFGLLQDCRGNIFYWQHMPNPVFDSKNNFIRINLPKEFSDNSQKLTYKEYMVAVLREEKETVFERMVLINPDRGLNFFKLWNNHEQFRFPAGCELVFPVSSGENKYEVHLGNICMGILLKYLNMSTFRKTNLLELLFIIKDFLSQSQRIGTSDRPMQVIPWLL